MRNGGGSALCATRDAVDSRDGSCGCARPRDAKRYLEKYKRLDVAIDAYYTNPNGFPAERSGVSTTKINQLFDQYKGAPRRAAYHARLVR